MKRLMAVAVAGILAGCGGGGGGDTGGTGGSSEAASITYFQQGGLTWSSTSAKTYIDVPLGSSLPLDQSAGFYCNGKVDGVLKNFNKEDGWRLPTLVELQALYAAMPKPPGFVSGRVWATGSTSMFAVDFATGNTVAAGNTSSSSFYVTCVKKT